MGSVRWRVLLWWVLASAAGYTVAGLTEAAAGSFSGVTVVAPLAVGATAASALQWPALRRHLSRPGWWMASGVAGAALVGVAAIAAGVFAGLAAGAVGDADAGRDFGADVASVTAAVMFGAALAVVQRRLLRPRFARLGCWLPAGSVGWIVAGLIAGVTEGIAGWLVLGAVYGAFTGWALPGLLRQEVGEEPATEQ
jgi:hypothetical protein